MASNRNEKKKRKRELAIQLAKMEKIEINIPEKAKIVEKPAEITKKTHIQQKREKISLLELKEFAAKPEVVEKEDQDASDPYLLVSLKSHKNAVQVPENWKQKKYIHGHSRDEELSFQIPGYLKGTGVEEYMEDIWKTFSLPPGSKERIKLRPNLDSKIDYYKLKEAFQNLEKPNIKSIYGKLYDPNAIKLVCTPGKISPKLAEALGIPHNPKYPPPWIFKMQTHGLPPAFPFLKVPGVNAPIPPGAKWGYQPGGWGSPPVYSDGRPRWGDVFGLEQNILIDDFEPIRHWGEFKTLETQSIHSVMKLNISIPRKKVPEWIFAFEEIKEPEVVSDPEEPIPEYPTNSPIIEPLQSTPKSIDVDVKELDSLSLQECEEDLESSESWNISGDFEPNSLYI